MAETHRMLPGSHERPGGAECVCGATWSRWDDRCLAPADAVRPDLAMWLTEQINEDAGVAREATPGPWTTVETDFLGYGVWWEVCGAGSEEDRAYVAEGGGEGGGTARPEDAAHIARHDPSRVLAECEAKRVIITEFEECRDEAPVGDRYTGQLEALDRVIRTMGAVYADRPGYRSEWAP